MSTRDSLRRPELISLTGKPLYSINAQSSHVSPERLDELECDLADAYREYLGDRNDPDKLIWAGRRLGYLWRFREAIALYTHGVEHFPDYAPLLRHRGHRQISMRRFDLAIDDLKRAAELIEGKPDEIESDGAPNRLNIPLTTTSFNVWYHLALARYLTGDFEGALAGWWKTMRYTIGYDDNVVAISDWMYMTLRRLGRDEEAMEVLARISQDMKIIENSAYHRRLLMYKGIIKPDDLLDMENASDLDIATLGYGLGNWYLYNGDTKRAIEVFERVLASPYWAAFGYIASEVELARLRQLSAAYRPQPKPRSGTRFIARGVNRGIRARLSREPR